MAYFASMRAGGAIGCDASVALLGTAHCKQTHVRHVQRHAFYVHPLCQMNTHLPPLKSKR